MKPKTALVLLAGLPGLAWAGDCSDIKDDMERLRCYDARNAPREVATDVVPAQPAPPAEEAPTPAPAPASVPEPETAETVRAASPDEFGKEEPIDAPREFIEARIDRITTSGAKEYYWLDNGQVWRQAGGSNRMRYRKGDKVTITEGVLGSFDLKVEGRNKIIKVTRVR
jgi:hypothetical protein